ncbi:transglutaminase-like cysteine peptidase [Methyloligella sp. 2.7D]|uniref:transglutaminase-like cysteine peptidase n=1 Tax=unclassified Methyloligella TaxID=2625955 RepID=UPI00157D43BD|nr:transglutaminase-like cysteine peptidase [Methyloligella sp. GL2]QKP77302.1 transglutaminase-like cysteine peptidase [Methyloligella sp. GL2]
MFASSYSAKATTDHVIPVTHTATVQKAYYMQAFGQTLPPIGYVTFCRENRGECTDRSVKRFRVRLSERSIGELIRVNEMVNQSIAPMSDMELYGQPEVWTYPASSGDCEDYVLLKRKMLMQRGWPQSALLITVVRDENNEGHAVLTVRTDKGDYILDNKQSQIRLWTDTPYVYVKRQSERNPLVWISLVPPSQLPQTQFSASQSNR